MATTLEELVFKFEADLSGLRADLQEANKRLDQLGATTEKTGKRMQTALGNLGRLFKFDMLVRYGRQLLQVQDAQERLASAIRDTADRADIGVVALQRLRHAADQNGTSAEALDSALIRLNKAIGQARSGAANMRELFDALGLQEFIDKGASTEETFYAIADAVKELEGNEQAAAIVARIMGREADRLIELLQQGGKEARELGKQLQRVISEETINRLDTARDKTEEFKKVLNSFAADAVALAYGIGTNLVGALVEFYDWFEKITGFMSGALWFWEQWARLVGNTVESFQRLPKGALQGINAPTSSGTPEAPSPSSGARGRGVNQNALGNLFGSSVGGADAAANAVERYRDAVADLIFETQQLARTEAEAAYQEELRNRLTQAGIPLYGKLTDTQERHKEAIDELTQAYISQARARQEADAAWEVEAANANREIEEMHERMREQAREWERIGDAIEDGVVEAFLGIVDGSMKASEAIAALIADIGRLIAKALILKAIEGVTNAIFGGSSGGKALGGLVNAGNAYMVGESGPELFVPRATGQIVPSNRIGGGMTLNYAPVINAQNGVTRADMVMALAQDRAEFARQVPGLVQSAWKRGSVKFG